MKQAQAVTLNEYMVYVSTLQMLTELISDSVPDGYQSGRAQPFSDHLEHARTLVIIKNSAEQLLTPTPFLRRRIDPKLTFSGCIEGLAALRNHLAELKSTERVICACAMAHASQQ